MGRFIPSVCYRLTHDTQAAVEKLALDGDARLYAEEVRFISGVPHPVKKPGQLKSTTGFVPEILAQGMEEPGKAGKQGKTGNKRNGFVGQRDFN